MMEQYRKLWRMLPMAEKKKILYIVEAMVICTQNPGHIFIS